MRDLDHIKAVEESVSDPILFRQMAVDENPAIRGQFEQYRIAMPAPEQVDLDGDVFAAAKTRGGR